MIEKTTTQRLFEHYNSFLPRATVENYSSKKKIFSYLHRILSPWLPLDKDTKILDVGCGEGSLLTFLKEKGYTNLSGFDISPENVEICHRLGLKFVQQLDVLQISETSEMEKFDVIFALDILEHIPKQLAANFLEQLHKQLNENGCIIIQTPNMGSIFAALSLYGDLSHEFGLTEKTALSLLAIAGFDANKVEIKASWNASTPAGYLREAYLKILHKIIFLAEGAGRPRIPTKNLLIRAFN
jgi:2-polyprenyl-3-methyl-5-hydroxy-6-metoxy-1,4-benzoquinol methylase